jgi:hypothetical protein
MPKANIKKNQFISSGMPGIIGLVFAILLPPLGFAWSLIVIVRSTSKTNKTSVKAARFGVAISVIIIISTVLFDAYKNSLPNYAQPAVAPIVSVLEDMGGRKIRDEKHPGLVTENSSYIAVYSVPDSPELAARISSSAKEMGLTLYDSAANFCENTYPFHEDKSGSTYLKSVPSDDKSLTGIPWDRSLVVDIYRSPDQDVNCLTSSDKSAFKQEKGKVYVYVEAYWGSD